jgi:hypothetical protein
MKAKNLLQYAKLAWYRIAGPYFCLVPFGSAALYTVYKRRLVSDFDTLCSMTDLQDDVFKTLSAMQFKVDTKHHDLRALIPRGKVCPDSKQRNAVELDSIIWITDKLRPIQKYFEQYDIGGDIVATATYIDKEDNVLLTLQSVKQDVLDDMQRFININKAMTVLWLLWLFTILVACV